MTAIQLLDALTIKRQYWWRKDDLNYPPYEVCEYDEKTGDPVVLSAFYTYKEAEAEILLLNVKMIKAYKRS